MFLLKRRSDNKFYINKVLKFRVYNRATKQYDVVPREFWVDDPNECVPFPTLTAARASATRFVVCPYPMLSWRDSTEAQRNIVNMMRTAWFNDRRARVAERDLSFEIIPINYNFIGGMSEGTSSNPVPPQEEVGRDVLPATWSVDE